MSREVELKNISMTATTPEDVQISLGHLTGLSTKNGYADNAGILDKAENKQTADNGDVKAPSAGNNSTDMKDWSNTIDFSKYYELGRIIPASSNSGASIFFTPWATGVGKTIKCGATFYTAADGKTAGAEATELNGTAGVGSGSLMTTLHAVTSTQKATDADTVGTAWAETTAVNWNNTNDDGYYVDIPVWLRTSAKDGVKLSVDAYVIPKTATFTTGGTEAENVLYKAMRVAIVPDADATENEAGVNKLLPVKDGWDNVNNQAKADGYAAANASIVDFYGRDLTTGAEDPDAKGTKAAASSESDYDAPSNYTAGSCVVDLTGAGNVGQGTQYGAARKYYVRVWLEGEDPECWNANAGQDFTVNLKFTKIEAAQSQTGD